AAVRAWPARHYGRVGRRARLDPHPVRPAVAPARPRRRHVALPPADMRRPVEFYCRFPGVRFPSRPVRGAAAHARRTCWTRRSTTGTGERGQATVEILGLLPLIVILALAGMTVVAS